MDFGIIILRHVNCKDHDKYWQEAYKCIRIVYSLIPIVIIDDNSDYQYVSIIPLENCKIIQSEYKGHGELLPYLYLLKHKWFKTMLFIHDTVFLKEKLTCKCHNFFPLWSFDCLIAPQSDDQLLLIKNLENNDKLIKFHDSNHWNGIFGCMTVISLSFLEQINKKHNLFNLAGHITTRYKRMSLERVLGVLFYYYHYRRFNAIYDTIHRYLLNNDIEWGYTFDKYKKENKQIPIVKVWSGR